MKPRLPMMVETAGSESASFLVNEDSDQELTIPATVDGQFTLIVQPLTTATARQRVARVHLRQLILASCSTATAAQHLARNRFVLCLS